MLQNWSQIRGFQSMGSLVSTIRHWKNTYCIYRAVSCLSAMIVEEMDPEACLLSETKN
jgi:hypothetical protein